MIKSSVVIAKLLCSEGFTDHLGNQIEKYWKASIMRNQARRRIARLEKEFSEVITGKLDMKERLLLGRFIALHKRMSFDAGLRIGLQAFQMKCAEVETGDISPEEAEGIARGLADVKAGRVRPFKEIEAELKIANEGPTA